MPDFPRPEDGRWTATYENDSTSYSAGNWADALDQALGHEGDDTGNLVSVEREPLVPADNADSVKSEEGIVPDAEHRSFIVTQVQIMVGRLGMEWPDDDQRDNFIAGIADDLYAKFEIAPQPHQVPPVFTAEPDIDEAIDRAKWEILCEVQAGRFVGSQIKRFADLHDHMDANTLGGLADDDFPLTDDEQIDFGNELQGRLDEWIRNGGLTNGIDASNDKWLTVGELRRHLAGFPDDTPITATNAGGVDYLNVVGASNPYQTGEPSLVLETRDDFDVRQF